MQPSRTGGVHFSIKFVLLCVAAFKTANAGGASVSVQLKNVRYVGELHEVLDRKVAYFLGMRYAEKPGGRLRFKKPTPANVNGSMNVGKYPNSCHQWRDYSFGKDFRGTDMWNTNTVHDEDCLYLNVWTPLSREFSDSTMPKNSAMLPVMVWIYGGGFYSGTSSLDVYKGQWLSAAEKVVVVSMNYRVAALGFLALGTLDAPGNAGLWDQLEALLWVKENIVHFGGDPERVTLFGGGAGAASVSMHILSAKSKGLFQNAILQSASAFSPWAILPMHVMKDRASMLAKRLGCIRNSRNGEDVDMACMYKVPATKMVATEISMSDLRTSRFQNAAVIDEDFLTSDVIKQLREGSFVTDVNILAGFNKNEGNYPLIRGTKGFTGDFATNRPITFFQYREGLHRALLMYPWKPLEPKDQPYNHIEHHHRETNFSLYAIDFRYGVFDSDLLRSTAAPTPASLIYNEALDRIVGDINFVCPVMRFLNCGPDRRTPDSGKKFLYRFWHRSAKSPWPEWMGTMHRYEIEFVFGIPLNGDLRYTREEVKLSELMMQYWANFARTGDPNFAIGRENGAESQDLEHWPEYEKNRITRIIFDIAHNVEPSKETLEQSRSLRHALHVAQDWRHCGFWNDYYPLLEGHIIHNIRDDNDNDDQKDGKTPNKNQPVILAGLLELDWNVVGLLTVLVVTVFSVIFL